MNEVNTISIDHPSKRFSLEIREDGFMIIIDKVPHWVDGDKAPIEVSISEDGKTLAL